MTYPGHTVADFDDWLVLAEVPDDTPPGVGGGEDMLNLVVPREARHVVRRLGTNRHTVSLLITSTVGSHWSQILIGHTFNSHTAIISFKIRIHLDTACILNRCGSRTVKWNSHYTDYSLKLLTISTFTLNDSPLKNMSSTKKKKAL